MEAVNLNDLPAGMFIVVIKNDQKIIGSFKAYRSR